ncbi:MAG: tetratricopeptide repeat protein [Bacteroidota bacterium]
MRRRLVGLGLILSAAAGLAAAAGWPWEEDPSFGPLGAAWIWLSAGHFERAAAEAQRIIAKRPSDTEAHLVLALLLQERGDVPRAEREYRLAFPRAADRPYLETCLGQLHLARDEWSAAAAHFRAALAASPDLGQAGLGLAQALAGSGRRADAIGVLRRLVKASPAWPEAFLYLGDLLESGGADPEELSAVYSQGSANNPNHPELHLRLARALSRLGQTDKAREEYGRVLALDPENEEARKAVSHN